MVTVFFERLRNGVDAAELASPFDVRTKPAYLLIGVSAPIALALFFAFGFTIQPMLALSLTTWVVILALSGCLLRRIGHPKIGSTAEAIALIHAHGVFTLLVLFPLTVVTGSYIDALLSRADVALGLDYHAVIYWPSATTIGNGVRAYKSFHWQPLLLIAIFCAVGNYARVWTFVTAYMVATILTCLIYPFFPALGTFHYYGITPALYPQFEGDAPWHFPPIIQAVKEHGVRFIGPDMLTGMVSFPSFHAAAAVLFGWLSWGNRWLRIGFVPLNIAMAVAALIVGAHYFVDILGGAVVGVAAIWIAHRLHRAILKA